MDTHVVTCEDLGLVNFTGQPGCYALRRKCADMFTRHGGAVVDTTRAHLADEMDVRRIELGLRWTEVARTMPMSVQNLARIRNGEITVTREAAAAIERALRWQAGSVRQVLAGGEPTPLEGTPAIGRARWKTYRVTAEEAFAMLQVALEDYGAGGFWREFDFIYERRESTQRTSDESPSDQAGRTA
jgi:hypothetical protein